MNKQTKPEVASLLGARVKRREDARLLAGAGRYLDDLKRPGLLQVAILRSPLAHARITSINAETAQGRPGIHAVFTASDFPGLLDKPMPQTGPLTAEPPRVSTLSPLATDEVVHVGQAIAVVVADTRAEAEDALRHIIVSYDPLDAATDARQALKTASRARLGNDNNRAGRFEAGFGDIDAAFANAAFTTKLSLTSHRGGGHSMETRGVLAEFDDLNEVWTVTTSTQMPHTIRKHLATHFGVEETQFRVRAPDVGGGFGPKGIFYPEEVILPALAKRLGRPLVWVEDRSEHFVASVQQRDQHWDAEVAIAEDGAILGVRLRGINDCGAALLYGLLLPLNTVMQFPGPYRWGALELQLDAVFTNLTPTSPVRGAGRPYANFVIERIMDGAAKASGLTPLEIRRRNLIPDDAYPAQSGMKNLAGVPITYDSGSAVACMEAAIAASEYERERKVSTGPVRRGLGLAVYNEDTGIPPFEGARVIVLPTGRILVRSGAASQGQGHETVLSQIAADVLGVELEDVTVKIGDTQEIERGIGTLGSRIAVMAGNSVYGAARKVREKAIRFAAERFEVSEDAIVVSGSIFKAGNQTLSLAEIATALNGTSGVPIPHGFEPGLEATDYYLSTSSVYSNGAVVIEVDVDTDTGGMEVTRCVFAHDCGRMINPLIVEGQVIGGAVHGLGNALFEEMRYDASGQPMSMNYGEYLLPTATEIPRFDIIHLETPSPNNALGLKGVGESGTIPMASAVAAAIDDALSEFGSFQDHHPIGPEDILKTAGHLP